MKYDPNVEVEGLTYSYGGPPVLSEVNLNLKRGERCLLVGGYPFSSLMK